MNEPYETYYQTDIPSYPQPPKKKKHTGLRLCALALVFALLGIPLLWPDSPLVLLGIIGLMWAIIVVIVVYLRIEQKYKK